MLGGVVAVFGAMPMEPAPNAEHEQQCNAKFQKNKSRHQLGRVLAV